MSFSLADFQQILRNIGQERVAMLAGKYPDVVEPFLPKIEKRLREKGLIKAATKDPDLYLSLVGDPAGKSWSVIYRGEAKSALAPMETAAAAYDRLHYEIYKRKVPDDAPVWDGNRGVFTTFNAVFGDAPKALTDKDAWTQLANLVPVALASYPDTVRTALERAFRSEASRA